MKHSFKACIRLFHIWQVLGYNPWKKPRASKKKGKDFYKGAFDSIPFLNDDAKRTFVHLLLRPGYMIRDYINGNHDRYLAQKYRPNHQDGHLLWPRLASLLGSAGRGYRLHRLG